MWPTSEASAADLGARRSLATASLGAPGAGPCPAPHCAAPAEPVSPVRRSVGAVGPGPADRRDSSAARPARRSALAPGSAGAAVPVGAVPGLVHDLRAPAAHRPSRQDRIADRPAAVADRAPVTALESAPAPAVVPAF